MGAVLVERQNRLVLHWSKILSRVILVLALMFFSLKPSVTSRLAPRLISRIHHAFLARTAMSKKPTDAGQKITWRSSFQRDEDRVRVVPAVSVAKGPSIQKFQVVHLVLDCSCKARVFSPLNTAVLRI